MGQIVKYGMNKDCKFLQNQQNSLTFEICSASLWHFEKSAMIFLNTP